ncbi:tetratricopeptide repeat protein [Bradyrhizobium sp. USDA 3240]
MEEAVASYRMALRLRPAYPEAYNNLGWCRLELRECGAWTVFLSASRSSAVGKRPSYPGCRLSAVDASWLSPIMIAGNSDHDRLETMITLLWNG